MNSKIKICNRDTTIHIYFSVKNKINKFSNIEVIEFLLSKISCDGQTDRQTDGRTDRHGSYYSID